ncbi:unnamed protein product [Meganyctiphanes norvegica]|uniref:Uncharacterized protein n=1 Tax=Meganyctiphanes norvegica TaxID=48144 RepID=A0AAV2SBR0_MEGNR
MVVDATKVTESLDGTTVFEDLFASIDAESARLETIAEGSSNNNTSTVTIPTPITMAAVTTISTAVTTISPAVTTPAYVATTTEDPCFDLEEKVEELESTYSEVTGNEKTRLQLRIVTLKAMILMMKAINAPIPCIVRRRRRDILMKINTLEGRFLDKSEGRGRRSIDYILTGPNDSGMYTVDQYCGSKNSLINTAEALVVTFIEDTSVATFESTFNEDKLICLQGVMDEVTNLVQNENLMVNVTQVEESLEESNPWDDLYDNINKELLRIKNIIEEAMNNNNTATVSPREDSCTDLQDIVDILKTNIDLLRSLGQGTSNLDFYVEFLQSMIDMMTASGVPLPCVISSAFRKRSINGDLSISSMLMNIQKANKGYNSDEKRSLANAQPSINMNKLLHRTKRNGQISITRSDITQLYTIKPYCTIRRRLSQKAEGLITQLIIDSTISALETPRNNVKIVCLNDILKTLTSMIMSGEFYVSGTSVSSTYGINDTLLALTKGVEHEIEEVEAIINKPATTSMPQCIDFDTYLAFLRNEMLNADDETKQTLETVIQTQTLISTLFGALGMDLPCIPVINGVIGHPEFNFGRKKRGVMKEISSRSKHQEELSSYCIRAPITGSVKDALTKLLKDLTVFYQESNIDEIKCATDFIVDLTKSIAKDSLELDEASKLDIMSLFQEVQDKMVKFSTKLNN